MSYCIFTSNYSFIDNDGFVALCCKNAQNKIYNYNIREHSLKEIWHSAHMTKVRNLLSTGGEPKGCNVCTEPENAGIQSFRQKTLHSINKGKQYNNTNIYALDLRLGNICNLACTMCHPGNSNKIYNNLPKMSNHWNWSKSKLDSLLTRFDKKQYGWANDPKAWDNIISSIDPELRHVYLAGGEPFYIKNFPTTVERIWKAAPNAVIAINTNGTRLLRDKDLKTLTQIKNIHMSISVDGYGPADEYTRQGTIWKDKVAVMDQYYKEFDVRSFDITANALNVRHIPKLIDWLVTRYPHVDIMMRPVIKSPEIMLSSIPSSFKQESLDYFIKNKNNIIGADHVIHEMQKPLTSSKTAMQRFISYFDTHGVLTLESFDPELAKWINTLE